MKIWSTMQIFLFLSCSDNFLLCCDKSTLFFSKCLLYFDKKCDLHSIKIRRIFATGKGKKPFRKY